MSLYYITGSKAAPATARQLPVHAQPFAFRVPQVHDESVKLSSTTRGRSSALDAAGDAKSIVFLRTAPLPQAGPAHAGISLARFINIRPWQRQFLFATNERFSLDSNFATNTKQTTSKFLIATNERSAITTHQPLLDIHAFLIAGQKILKTAVTPSVPIPSAFLIAGVCPPIVVRSASARSSAAGCSSHFGNLGLRGTARGAQIAGRSSPITTYQAHLTKTRRIP
jgi:hypothetical protein